MIERYEKPEIKEIWSDKNKHFLWKKVEIAVINARAKLGRIAKEVALEIDTILRKPIDLEWCKAREAKTHHDLNSAVDERKRYLPDRLEGEYHKEVTSFDDEDPAMAEMLQTSADLVIAAVHTLRTAIEQKAMLYRYTPMLARTHGQWAQIQSFGNECLCWHEDLETPLADIGNAASRLKFTKCSGAIGNNAEIDPELELAALAELGRRPWHGATQIMPRGVYAPLASSLAHLVSQCEKIALDIRLASRSGCKILEEPFDINQEGSSAMPQKRNPIRTEQICGMARVARHFAGMIEENIPTWESRSIEQSCVERIAWPDLFHVTLHALKVLTKVIDGLNVYPDQMMREIVASAGTYASNAAKTFLAERGKEFGITSKDAYGIVRLASHIAFAPSLAELKIRNVFRTGVEDADGDLALLLKDHRELSTVIVSIEDIIMGNSLHAMEDIGVNSETSERWNLQIFNMFASENIRNEWHALFKPSRGMKNEAHSFRQVFKV